MVRLLAIYLDEKAGEMSLSISRREPRLKMSEIQKFKKILGDVWKISFLSLMIVSFSARSVAANISTLSVPDLDFYNEHSHTLRLSFREARLIFNAYCRGINLPLEGVYSRLSCNRLQSRLFPMMFDYGLDFNQFVIQVDPELTLERNFLEIEFSKDGESWQTFEVEPDNVSVFNCRRYKKVRVLTYGIHTPQQEYDVDCQNRYVVYWNTSFGYWDIATVVRN